MRRTSSLRTSSLRTPALALAAAAALLLAGCSADPAENEAAACSAFAEFSDSVSAAKGTLNADSTIGEITDARDRVQQSAQDLAAALESVATDRVSAVESAVDTFASAVEGVDPELTVPEAIRSLQPDFTKVEAAQTQLDEALACE
ncbi:hypothetical protein [Leucobacter sp. PH1c]|uniref:hypothetical protein n=1 Tax=Leucobacter sp. PH1c TaxID=1397278 RepID=UPI0004692462|nr:hypothetical protein [Leucobacter sp. PH1c]